jgi:hypothetical protein
MNLTFQNTRASTGLGATTGSFLTSQQGQNGIVTTLNQMCYTNHKMVLNMPGFLRSLCSKVKDENNNLVFDY